MISTNTIIKNLERSTLTSKTQQLIIDLLKSFDAQQLQNISNTLEEDINFQNMVFKEAKSQFAGFMSDFKTC